MAPQPARITYYIYIGFVSNKGTLKSAPPVKVTYRPKQTTPVGGPTAPAQPTGTGKDCTSDVDPNGVARFCVNSENRDRFKNVCSGGQLNYEYKNCPPSHPSCLIGADVICSPKSTAQPTAQPTPTSKPLATCDTLFADCMRIYGAETPEFDKCSLMKTQCELAKTGDADRGFTASGGLPPSPTPIPTLIPSLEETPGLLQNDIFYIQNATDHLITINYIEIETTFFWKDKISTEPIDLSPGANYTYSEEVNSKCSLVDNIIHARKNIKLQYYDFKENTTKIIQGVYVCKENGLITIR